MRDLTFVVIILEVNLTVRLRFNLRKKETSNIFILLLGLSAGKS